MFCPICLDSFTGCQYVSFRCNHNVHKQCLYNLYINTNEFKCPLCRIAYPLGLQYETKHVIEKHFFVIDSTFQKFFNYITEYFINNCTNIFKNNILWNHLFFWYVRSFQIHINYLQSILLTYEKNAHFVFWGHGLKILPSYNLYHI